ncbi:uncharacterized protein N7484_007460 [Penicillium longicatenatum]|uniref:uncharacterized protein n=1 Tax=Penicillium longicatenatum TaxID=1561947 RepID=UPI002547F230|nr:uncharacterized protein N7484_007460 [Penicillium longicatenatum]KAJ5639598.1 hypothetical protein N7484_007460 [Penicillium longicatenatum]
MFFRNSGGTVSLSSKDSANIGIVSAQNIMQDTDHFQGSDLPNMDVMEDKAELSAIPSTGIGEIITPFWGDLAELQTLRDDIDWLFEPLQEIPTLSAPKPSECDISLPNFDFPTMWQAEPILLDDVNENEHRSPADIAEWSLAHSNLLMALNQFDTNILQSPFFEVDNLKMFHDLYFHHYHPHFPIFHRPTLIISEVEPLLLITLLTLGSTMAKDSKLYELEWIFFSSDSTLVPAGIAHDSGSRQDEVIAQKLRNGTCIPWSYTDHDETGQHLSNHLYNPPLQPDS